MTSVVLFDLDDTLLNTLPSRMRALAHAYQTCLGESVDALALWRSHRGGTLELMGERLLGGDGQRFVDTYREFYYANDRTAAPFEGVTWLLEALAGQGVQMGVVTSKIIYGAVDELEAARLLRFFGCVIGFDDTERHKPDPDPLFEALDRLCVDDVTTVAFVGDSPADILAARNAGVRSVAALWGTLDEELLLDAMPDLTATLPAEVHSCLYEGATP